MRATCTAINGERLGELEIQEKRILVVDDDEAIRALLLTILRRRGFHVDVARNGAEALERLEKCRYVVMLLDLMMPIVNGWEVLESLQGRPKEDRPVTIVLTAGTEPRDLSADVVAGTVKKPFDVELLLDGITACIASLPDRSQLSNCPPSDSDNRGKTIH